MNESPLASLIAIYPNPVSDRLTVNIDPSIEAVSYQVLDVQGKVIQTGNLSTTNSQIEVAGYAQGIYFLNLKTAQESLSLKFVKR